jgi:zinc transporter
VNDPDVTAVASAAGEAGESTYGSDRNGLVWGFLFDPERSATPIDSHQAAAWLGENRTEAMASYLWLHFSLSNAASVRWMRQHLDLPETFFDLIAGDSGSTRVEQTDEALVAVIHDVLFDFAREGAEASVVCLCAQPRIVVSARVKPLRSLDQLRSSVKAGRRFCSTADLLAELLREQAGVLIEIIRGAARQVDTIEDTLIDNRLSATRRDLGTLRRAWSACSDCSRPSPRRSSGS